MNDASSRIVSAKSIAAVLLLLSVATFLALHRDQIDIFSYYSWRQTQTFAGYHCLQAASSAKQMIKCVLASPPGYSDSNMVGLEFAFFQLVDFVLNPGQSFDQVTSVLPALSVVLFLFLLASQTLWWAEASIAGWVVAAVLFFAPLHAPVMLFFTHAYQPDVFSLALILLGLIILQRKSDSRLGALLVGLGVICKPQHLPIAFAAIPLPLRLRGSRQDWRAYAKTVAWSALLVVVFFCAQYVLRLRGIEHYQHKLFSFSSLPELRSIRFEIERWRLPLGFVGAAAIFAIDVAFFALALSLGRWSIAVSMGGVGAALMLTLVFFFQGFLSNSYYAIIPLAALLLAGVAGLPMLRVDAASDRRTQMTLLICVFFGVVAGFASPWWFESHGDIHFALNETAGMVEGEKSTCSEAAQFIATHDSPRYYMDCMPQDPTCRVSANFADNTANAYQDQLRDPAFVTRLKNEHAYYVTCIPYSAAVLKDEVLRSVVAANADEVFADRGLHVFRFHP